MDTVVVGVDGTADSLDALAGAARIGDEIGAGLVVVFVRHESALASAAGAGAAGVAIHSTLDAQERSAYERAVAVLADRGVHWRFEVRDGDPATELIGAARQHRARAIVVGGRSHGLVGGVVTASVAQKLVRHSPVSVLVVREPARGSVERSKSTLLT